MTCGDAVQQDGYSVIEEYIIEYVLMFVASACTVTVLETKICNETRFSMKFLGYHPSTATSCRQILNSGVQEQQNLCLHDSCAHFFLLE